MSGDVLLDSCSQGDEFNESHTGIADGTGTLERFRRMEFVFYGKPEDTGHEVECGFIEYVIHAEGLNYIPDIFNCIRGDKAVVKRHCEGYAN